MRPGEPTLGDLPGIMEQVPSVCHLRGLRSTLRHAPGIPGGPVAGNDAHTWVSAQPLGQHGRGPSRQEGERPATHQIDQDGAVGPALAQSPVVDAECPRSRCGRQWHPFHEAQQGIGAGWHAQVIQQAGTALAAGHQGDPTLGRGETIRAPGPGGQQAIHRLGEGLPSAPGIATEEVSDPQDQSNLSPRRRVLP